jgi:hypothetical protein
MKTIGTVTTCDSTEHPYLRGYEVQVVAIFKGAAREDYDPDGEVAIATTDEELAALGGLEPGDRAEVTPWLPQLGRYSFATSDPRIEDLAAFRDLAP